MKSLPLDAIRWLVLIVVVDTAATMLRSASAEQEQARLPLAAEEELS